jgi:hypothetical protein
VLPSPQARTPLFPLLEAAPCTPSALSSVGARAGRISSNASSPRLGLSRRLGDARRPKRSSTICRGEKLASVLEQMFCRPGSSGWCNSLSGLERGRLTEKLANSCSSHQSACASQTQLDLPHELVCNKTENFRATEEFRVQSSRNRGTEGATGRVHSAPPYEQTTPNEQIARMFTTAASRASCSQPSLFPAQLRKLSPPSFNRSLRNSSAKIPRLASSAQSSRKLLKRDVS